MNHDELMERLERERISYPDQLEAERYMPGALERGHTPITPERARRNRARLAEEVEGVDV